MKLYNYVDETSYVLSAKENTLVSSVFLIREPQAAIFAELTIDDAFVITTDDMSDMFNVDSLSRQNKNISSLQNTSMSCDSRRALREHVIIKKYVNDVAVDILAKCTLMMKKDEIVSALSYYDIITCICAVMSNTRSSRLQTLADKLLTLSQILNITEYNYTTLRDTLMTYFVQLFEQLGYAAYSLDNTSVYMLNKSYITEVKIIFHDKDNYANTSDNDDN